VSISVLIVDDVGSFTESAARLLRAQGFEVAGLAADHQEALVAVRDLRPDAVLLDIHLPQMSGLQLARILLSDYKELRVLLTSSDVNAMTQALATQIGAVGFVPKDELATTNLHGYFSPDAGA
jgi:DNA-binding NarL/FixJ family response regulator